MKSFLFWGWEGRGFHSIARTVRVSYDGSPITQYPVGILTMQLTGKGFASARITCELDDGRTWSTPPCHLPAIRNPLARAWAILPAPKNPIFNIFRHTRRQTLGLGERPWNRKVPRDRRHSNTNAHVHTHADIPEQTRGVGDWSARRHTVCGQLPAANTVKAGSNSSSSSSQSTTACHVCIQGVPNRGLFFDNEQCVYLSAVGGTRFEYIGFCVYRNVSQKAFQSDFFYGNNNAIII